MKISDALAQAKRDLDLSGVSNSKLDALILLTHAISFSKEQIIFNPDFELNADQQKDFFALIARRSKREPVSHIIEKREFFGEDFFVNKDVLDPRPDSESLIELVLKKFPEKNQKLKILELGVGSGCLVITLLKAYKEAQAIGVDISDAALEICKKNAETHAVLQRLELLKSDLFEQILKRVQDDDAGTPNSQHRHPELVSGSIPNPKFDIIISNPPYISSREIETLEPEVRLHEPLTALDGGFDGLDFYRRIAVDAENFLAQNGKIFLEIGQNQEEKIIEIFTKKEFILSDSKHDLSGIIRILEFKK